MTTMNAVPEITKLLRMDVTGWRHRTAPGQDRLFDLSLAGKPGYPPVFWASGEDYWSKARDSRRLLEPGYASEQLTERELVYVRWWLERSPALRRWWGFKPSGKRFKDTTLLRVAQFGDALDLSANARLARPQRHPLTPEQREALTHRLPPAHRKVPANSLSTERTSADLSQSHASNVTQLSAQGGVA